MLRVVQTSLVPWSAAPTAALEGEARPSRPFSRTNGPWDRSQVYRFAEAVSAQGRIRRLITPHVRPCLNNPPSPPGLQRLLHRAPRIDAERQRARQPVEVLAGSLRKALVNDREYALHGVFSSNDFRLPVKKPVEVEFIPEGSRECNKKR